MCSSHAINSQRVELVKFGLCLMTPLCSELSVPKQYSPGLVLSSSTSCDCCAASDTRTPEMISHDYHTSSSGPCESF